MLTRQTSLSEVYPLLEGRQGFEGSRIQGFKGPSVFSNDFINTLQLTLLNKILVVFLYTPSHYRHKNCRIFYYREHMYNTDIFLKLFNRVGIYRHRHGESSYLRCQTIPFFFRKFSCYSIKIRTESVRLLPNFQISVIPK